MDKHLSLNSVGSQDGSEHHEGDKLEPDSPKWSSSPAGEKPTRSVIDLASVANYKAIVAASEMLRSKRDLSQTPVSVQTPVCTLKRRPSRVQAYGVYAGELASPEPKVRLPNFSITPYAESRPSKSSRDFG